MLGSNRPIEIVPTWPSKIIYSSKKKKKKKVGREEIFLCSSLFSIFIFVRPLSFYQKLDTLWDRDYLPSDQDIIRSRVKTTGIADIRFAIGPFMYHLVDVGGQRSERKKWLHYFDNVTAVLFVVAISGYDQVLIEDHDSVSSFIFF